MTTRRNLIAGLAVAASLAFVPVTAIAQGDPITMVVPYSAGGPVDGLTRLIAEGLSRKTGQTYLVENKPGANGIIGAQYVASTRTPQNTLFVGGTGPISVNLLTRKGLPFKAEDFKPVSLVAHGPMALTVPASAEYNDLDGFLAAAKASENPFRFGTFGPGSLSQLYGALLNRELGFEMTEVAYKTTADELKDMIGGQIDFTVSSPFGVIGQIRSGDLKMLAVASEERIPQLPEVPTFAELGRPQLTGSFWTGIFAPAEMDDAQVQAISAAIDEVLKEERTVEFLSNIAQFPVGGTPDELQKQLDQDREVWGAIVKERGIELQ
ncbi:tripartite tricarboxylate transporter substrate binding protein [Paracoccus sp. SY]|uniref:Bug family tripartite tricarboxylate transporter substrate binding protein n=1 Tax=Paracoccus sp. SY TaxID=1330255 RepID=UPI000CD181DC|nr:tripartite tricarboxylate transporter substrate binding protein [Paracoccus sp. SY]